MSSNANNDKSVGSLMGQMGIVVDSLKTINDKLDRVENQTTKTNGRVTSLEHFRNDYERRYTLLETTVNTTASIVKSMKENDTKWQSGIKWKVPLAITIIIAFMGAMVPIFWKIIDLRIQDNLVGLELEVVE